MPKYSFALTNGKKLTLEGDTQPTDAEVEEIARGQGVSLALAGTPGGVVSPDETDDPRKAAEMGFKEGAMDAAKGVLRGAKNAVVSALNPMGMVRAVGHMSPTMMGQELAEDLVQGAPRGRETLTSVVEGVKSLNPTDPRAPEAWGNVGANVAMMKVAPNVSPSGGLKLVNSAMKTAANAVSEHPTLASAAGAGLGYVHGGPWGAVEGALGGLGLGALGKVGKILKLGKSLPEILGGSPSGGAPAPPPPMAVSEPTSRGPIIAEPGQYARPERTALPPGARQMPPGADPSFVRGVPGEYPESVLRGEPVGVRPSTPMGPIIEGEILNGGALPPRRGTPMGASTKPDPSFVRAEPAQYATREKPVPRGGLPPVRRGIEMGPSTTNDPSFVRAEPAQVAQVERSGPPSLKQEVERLSREGLDAKTIADRLKDHPELAKATSKQERTNLVREARGGPSGQIPARAKAAIDEAIGNLKTIEEKRAYLMRAPNGQVYDYVKAKLGL